jgi:hypothetical protein
MAKGDWFVGWRLEAAARDALMQAFGQRYARLVADHVTLDAHATTEAALPQERGGDVVGEADDGHGVQALVVRIGGTTDRPGGGTYHITWSLEPGRSAVESNDVIARVGWRSTPEIAVALTPVRRRGS